MPARPYLTIFGALLALTLLTVLMASLHLGPGPTVAIGLIIATAKAALVALFFMHLKGEKAMVYWPLALTVFLFAAMLAFILWSEADHITSSSNTSMIDDVPIDVTIAPLKASRHRWSIDSIDVSIDEPIIPMNASMQNSSDDYIDRQIINHRSSNVIS